MIKNFSDFLTQINEGLITTYPILKAIKFLKKLLDYNKYDYNLEYDNDTIFIKFININLNRLSIDQITQLINSCGYFISLIRFYDKNDVELNRLKPNYNKDYNHIYNDIININSYYIQFEVESKFNYVVLSKKYLYHLTNKSFLDKILKNGLIPKSGNKLSIHPTRIYLSYTRQGALNLINQFEYKDPILLKINVENMKLYSDPDYENGCYVNQNIPPKNIEVIV